MRRINQALEFTLGSKARVPGIPGIDPGLTRTICTNLTRREGEGGWGMLLSIVLDLVLSEWNFLANSERFGNSRVIYGNHLNYSGSTPETGTSTHVPYEVENRTGATCSGPKSGHSFNLHLYIENDSLYLTNVISFCRDLTTSDQQQENAQRQLMEIQEQLKVKGDQAANLQIKTTRRDDTTVDKLTRTISGKRKRNG